jgi:RNA polymerase sigma-70 factor, ECF subfamily
VNLDLNELARKARDDDSQAFRRLAEATAPHGHRLAWRLLGDADQAADVVQEFLIKLLRVLDRYDPARPFLPWALRIVTRMALDQRRRRVKHEHASLDDVLAYPANTADQPDSHLEAKETRRRLQALCGDLSEGQRVAFVLRDLEGFSVAEIAETTGAAASTVRVHLARARVKIHDAMLESEKKVSDEKLS